MAEPLREAFRYADSPEPLDFEEAVPYIPQPRRPDLYIVPTPPEEPLAVLLSRVVFAAERGEYCNVDDSEAFISQFDPFAPPHDPDEELLHYVHPYSDSRSLKRDFASDL